MNRISIKFRLVGALMVSLISLFFVLSPTKPISYTNTAKAATCPNTAPNGSAALSFNVDAANVNNDHTVWSRIMVSSTTSSYYLKLDASCYKVGGVSLPVNQWVWVKYQDGSTDSAITTKFTTIGEHTATFISDMTDVKVDQILMLTSDCDPSQSSDGLGDNCTASAVLATVTPTSTVTTSDTQTSTAGSAGPDYSGTSQLSPARLTAPSNLRTSFVSNNAMAIRWDNSTGGSGQLGYQIYLDGVSQGATTTNSFGVTGLSANVSHNIKVVAYDHSQPVQAISSNTKTFKTYSHCFLRWCW